MLSQQSRRALNGPLRLGSKGQDVRTLQTLLNDATPRTRLMTDGVFDLNTDQALRAFQRRSHLTADGVVGPRTAHALGIKYAGKPVRPPLPPRPGGHPLPPTKTPLTAIADAMIEGLRGFCDVLKQDILDSGAIEEKKRNAIEAMDELFQFGADDFKKWSGDAIQNPTAEAAEFDALLLAHKVLGFEQLVIKVATYVRDKGKGDMARLGARLRSLDVDAIVRVVKLTLQGSKSEGLQAALWDLHFIFERASRKELRTA